MKSWMRLPSPLRRLLELVDALREQELHHIDSHREVGRILPLRVGELLYRLNRKRMQDLFPGVATFPVAIRPADARLPELGEFFHDAVDGVCLGVVAVDNQGYFLFRVHNREYMIFFRLEARKTELLQKM